jgi:hypothetical protein
LQVKIVVSTTPAAFPKSGAPENARLGNKKNYGEKRSSLFIHAVTDTGKKFYNLDTWFVRSSQCQKGIDMPWMIASLVPMLKKFFVVS